MIAGAYLLGSIPFALLIGFARGVDVRKHGSGNVGATNVRRVCGAGPGALCLVLDFLKGFAPTLAAGLLSGAALARDDSAATAWLWLAVAAAAMLGHIFPVWLRFRGGKGVATGLGATVGVWPVMTAPALGALLVWTAALRLTRNVGVSSSIAAAAFPLLLAAFVVVRRTIDPDTPALEASLPFLLVATLLAALVILRHRRNLVDAWRAQRAH
jgi:glycerol-3-phosphate acyltransferase PlsY